MKRALLRKEQFVSRNIQITDRRQRGRSYKLSFATRSGAGLQCPGSSCRRTAIVREVSENACKMAQNSVIYGKQDESRRLAETQENLGKLSFFTSVLLMNRSASGAEGYRFESCRGYFQCARRKCFSESTFSRTKAKHPMACANSCGQPILQIPA